MLYGSTLLHTPTRVSVVFLLRFYWIISRMKSPRWSNVRNWWRRERETFVSSSFFCFFFFVHYLFFSESVDENFHFHILNGNRLKRVQDAKIRTPFNCTLYVHFLHFFISAFLFPPPLHISSEFVPVIAVCNKHKHQLSDYPIAERFTPVNKQPSVVTSMRPTRALKPT